MPSEGTLSYFFRSAIGGRMVILILLFSSLITLIITAVQLSMDYHRDIALIQNRLHEIEAIHLDSIINNLWRTDHESVKLHLEGIMRMPDMHNVIINLADGDTIQIGNPVGESVIRLDFPMHFNYRNEKVYLGVLHATATLDGVYNRLIDKALVIFISQGIKTFLVSLFILVLFYYLVGRHLQAFVAYTRSLELAEEPPAFSFAGREKTRQRPDEMDQLLQAFNELWTRQRTSFLHLQQAEREVRGLSVTLAESRNLLQALLDHTQAIVTLKDVRGHYLLANRTFFTLLCPLTNVIAGLSSMDLFTPEMARKLVQNDDLVRNSGLPLEFEEVFILKEGKKTFLSVKFPLFNENNRIYAIGTISADISERKAAAQELLHLRNLLANIIDSMPSVLIGVDRQGCIIQWNRKAQEVTGHDISTALGKPLTELYPLLADQAEAIQKVIHARQGQRDTRIPWQEAGQLHYADVTIYPLIANGTDGAVIRVDDITERVHIEEMMVQAEKMLSVGGLAAGMAHEINNPLAGIMVNIQVIKQRLTGDLAKNHQVAQECGTSLAVIAAYLEQRGILPLIAAVTDAGGRAARIVESMLSFSRKSGLDTSPCSLAQLLDDTLELAANDYDLKKHYDFRHIHIKKEYDDRAPFALCVENSIQQVILNILKNGAQAMSLPGGSPEPCFTLRIKPDGQMVRVEIADNGPGMEESVCKRVFEPFFTTKEVGVGTGLGLSVSYFIVVENHRGTLEAESKPGLGAVFIMRLPAVREKS